MHARHNDQLEQWDRESFFHPSTHLAEFARGETCRTA
jgi:L-2,4-diaminobutyrate transaminase